MVISGSVATNGDIKQWEIMLSLTLVSISAICIMGRVYAQQGQVREVVFPSLCCVQLFGISWTTADQASPSFAISRSLLKLISIELVMPSNPYKLGSALGTTKCNVFMRDQCFAGI